MATQMFREEFSVTGTFQFPVDMLRYDACFPADETQSAYIESTRHAPALPVTVRLARYTRRDMAPVTPDRWKSFGWTVLDGSFESKVVS